MQAPGQKRKQYFDDTEADDLKNGAAKRYDRDGDDGNDDGGGEQHPMSADEMLVLARAAIVMRCSNVAAADAKRVFDARDKFERAITPCVRALNQFVTPQYRGWARQAKLDARVALDQALLTALVNVVAASVPLPPVLENLLRHYYAP